MPPIVTWTDIFETIAPDTLKDHALLARVVADAPLSLVTLVDGDRHWFTSLSGVSSLPDVDWDQSFCAHAVRSSSVFVVPDAAADRRFTQHPLVCAPPGVRFYGGAPLIADGQVVGTLCVMDTQPRDLSQASEHGLRALARQVVTHLQLMRHSRTLEGLQIELARTDASRRELMADVSHDLRTPLAALRGYLDTVVLKGPLDDGSRGHVERAIRLSDSATQLVADLFELSQLEMTAPELRLELFPLAELARDTVQSFSGIARTKHITIEFAAHAPGTTVRGDLRLIERVLWNLLDNAVRFTPDHGVIRVSCEPVNTHVMVRVRDSGPGISNPDHPHVFERRFRGDPAIAAVAPTSGLGLSIVKRIVELHNGTIAAGSSEPPGAEFAFTLPVHHGVLPLS